MSTHNQALQFYKAPGNNASGVAQPFLYCNQSQCSRDRNRCPGQHTICVCRSQKAYLGQCETITSQTSHQKKTSLVKQKLKAPSSHNPMMFLTQRYLGDNGENNKSHGHERHETSCLNYCLSGKRRTRPIPLEVLTKHIFKPVLTYDNNIVRVCST